MLCGGQCRLVRLQEAWQPAPRGRRRTEGGGLLTKECVVPRSSSSAAAAAAVVWRSGLKKLKDR